MSIMVIFAYWIKDLHNITLDMITTVVPYSILMRNEYFAEWYKNKFRDMYWKKVFIFLNLNQNNRVFLRL